VRLVPDEELERLYPKRKAIGEVTLDDGTHLTKRTEAVRGGGGESHAARRSDR
jgi:2-methylcitrate dehydratase PrpD